MSFLADLWRVVVSERDGEPATVDEPPLGPWEHSEPADPVQAEEPAEVVRPSVWKPFRCQRREFCSYHGDDDHACYVDGGFRYFGPRRGSEPWKTGTAWCTACSQPLPFGRAHSCAA